MYGSYSKKVPAIAFDVLSTGWELVLKNKIPCRKERTKRIPPHKVKYFVIENFLVVVKNVNNKRNHYRLISAIAKCPILRFFSKPVTNKSVVRETDKSRNELPPVAQVK